MKISFTITFFCFNSISYCQSIIDQKPKWSNIELQLSYESKDSLISRIRWDYPQGMINTYGERILTKPRNTYHFLHLNSDELIDAIYSGPSVNEGNSFTLFLNNGDSLTKIVGRQGTLISIKQTYPNSLIELTAVRFGCCDEPSNELYQAHFDPSKKKLIDSEGSYFIDDTEFPPYFEFRKAFKVTNESYHLRGSPEILNGEPEDYFFEKGNIIATYNSGDIGVALSQQEDETGRIWWFVLMNPKRKYQYHIDKYFSKSNAWFGWMSSRFVESIE